MKLKPRPVMIVQGPLTGLVGYLEAITSLFASISLMEPSGMIREVTVPTDHYVELAPQLSDISWSYNGADKKYHVTLDGKEVFCSASEYERSLFIAELTKRINGFK